MTTKAIAFLATKNADASRRFYEDALGLEFVEENEFAIVFDAFGTMLRIQKTPDVKVAPYTAFGLEVDDIATTLAAFVGKRGSRRASILVSTKTRAAFGPPRVALRWRG